MYKTFWDCNKKIIQYYNESTSGTATLYEYFNIPLNMVNTFFDSGHVLPLSAIQGAPLELKIKF